MIHIVNEFPSERAVVGAVPLANELRPVLLRLARELRRELAPLGLTAGQAALLHAIRTTRGVGIRELAAREGVSAPRVSAAVDRLQTRGLVERTRSGSDRRRVELTLTEEGERVLRSARRRRTAWLAARLARLDARERGAVAEALGPLTRLLEAEAE
ncbi:MAG: MarR family transcriptional regulator [Thermoleophilia bacterium]|nr:MarR family transcriptional regulator [Thermoleophilia bacterium]